MSMTSTDMAALLKVLYSKQKLIDMAARKNTFFGLISHDENGGGESIAIPCQIGHGGGASATFASAQANGSAPVNKKFVLTGVSLKSVITIDNDAIAAAKSSASAMKSTVELATKGKVQELLDLVGEYCVGDGTGCLAQFSAVDTGVFTLVDATKAHKFQAGDVVSFSASAGGTEESSLGYVIGSDSVAGTVTMATSAANAAAGTAGTPSGITTSYPYIHVAGSSGNIWSGLLAWCPTTAPTGSFKGVVRTGSTALGGNRYNATGVAIYEALVNAVQRSIDVGADPDYILINSRDYSDLVNSLGDKVRYIDVKTKASVGFKGVAVVGSNGDVPVVVERSMPLHTAAVIQSDTWKFFSVGPVPAGANLAGPDDQFSVAASADGMELRMAVRLACLGCNAPGYNLVVTNLGA